MLSVKLYFSRLPFSLPVATIICVKVRSRQFSKKYNIRRANSKTRLLTARSCGCVVCSRQQRHTGQSTTTFGLGPPLRLSLSKLPHGCRDTAYCVQNFMEIGLHIFKMASEKFQISGSGVLQIVIACHTHTKAIRRGRILMIRQLIRHRATYRLQWRHTTSATL